MTEPTVDVPFNGGTIQMRKFTTRDFLAIRKGELDDVGILELTVGAIVDYPGDPLDLSPLEMSVLLSAWLEAATETALPPATG